MKLVTILTAAALIGVAPSTWAAAPAAPAASVTAPDAARIKATQDLLAAMQVEKIVRGTAAASRYSNDAQRKAVMDKLEKVAPAEIYQRLATPVARLITTETATEMARFYQSSYGKKVLHNTYNSGPSVYGPKDPTPTGPEKAELKRAALVNARQALAQAESGIRHEAFVLVNAIVNPKR